MTDIAFPSLSRTTGQMQWGLTWNTGVFMSPLDASIQTWERPGARWKVNFTTAPLVEPDASILTAWLAKLKGQANRALIPNFSKQNIRGTVTGTPTINGSGQTGDSVNLAGCGNTKTLLAGDFIGFGGKLKMVTDDATSDGSGNMTVNIAPAIYPGQSPASGAAVTLVSPTCRMVLSDDGVMWDAQVPYIVGISLSFIEDPT